MKNKILVASLLLCFSQFGSSNDDLTTNNNNMVELKKENGDDHHHVTTLDRSTVGKKCGRGKSLRKKCKSVCLPKFSHESKNSKLAATPPMGWLSWERFRCKIDCKKDPENCISERLFKKVADFLVKDGYSDVGYEYVIMDDCWMAKTRDKNGRLQSDPERFPGGMKALVEYVHSKGLKFGIYTDYGNFTCGGYPGSLGFLETDANTFADWKVDYVKVDACYSVATDLEKGYQDFHYFLNKTGRKMVYSCSLPVYQLFGGIQPNFTVIKEMCQLWRIFDDIDDSWDSVTSIIDYFGDNQEALVPLAEPGNWNDPDMLIIGNFGLSLDQSKAQMALWAIFAGPLIMSVDLSRMRREHKKILKNKKIIAVNQDKLGIQGRRIFKNEGLEIWTRPISPVDNLDYSFAIVFLNQRVDGTPQEMALTIRQLGLIHTAGYKVECLFTNKNYGRLFPDDKINVRINPSGGVVMLRFTVVTLISGGQNPKIL